MKQPSNWHVIIPDGHEFWLSLGLFMDGPWARAQPEIVSDVGVRVDLDLDAAGHRADDRVDARAVAGCL